MAENFFDCRQLLDISGQLFFVFNAAEELVYTNVPQFSNIYLHDLKDKKMKMLHSRLFHISHGRQQNFEYFCLTDITDKKLLFAALERLSGRLEFAEKNAGIGYWEVDIRHRRIYWSAEMYRLLGIPVERENSKHNWLKERLFEEDKILYKQKLSELLKTHNPIEGHLRFKCDSKIIYCRFYAAYHAKEDKISGTLQDITPMIEIHQALNRARLSAEQASQAKSYFLAQASHDLRQPMQALSLFVNALQENEVLSPRQKKMVDKIEASVHNLKYLLDGLLDLSKLDSGGVNYNPEYFDIGILIERLSLEYAELAAIQQIKLTCRSCHCKIYSDPFLVERILRNLLGNALKFADSKILLGCRKKGNKLEISVRDNGVGIKKEEQDKIFQEFYQTSDNQTKTGTGLGLAIVARLAELLKTRITLNSMPGRGSCFSFNLKCEDEKNLPKTD